MIVQVIQLTGRCHLFSLMGRVPFCREVMHPEMPWMRVVSDGVEGWLSGAGVTTSAFQAAAFLPYQGQVVWGPAVGA